MTPARDRKTWQIGICEWNGAGRQAVRSRWGQAGAGRNRVFAEKIGEGPTVSSLLLEFTITQIEESRCVIFSSSPHSVVHAEGIYR